MTTWRKYLDGGGRFVWIDGSQPEPRAVVSRAEPGPEVRGRLLYAVLSQLDPTEWREVRSVEPKQASWLERVRAALRGAP